MATPPPGRLADGLLGQERWLPALERNLVEERLPHALLLLGPRGVGKTRAALALAQMLLCRTAPLACGQCPDCRRAAQARHPDLHLVLPATKDEGLASERVQRALEEYASDRLATLVPPGTTQIGIDAMRDLKSEVAKARVEAKRRVGIVLAAERMTEPAAQSALKLIEEPPPDTQLILTAEDAAGLLPTIVSRCRRVEIAPLAIDEAARVLEADRGLAHSEARLLASLGGGALGAAAALSAEDLLKLRDRALQVFDGTAHEPARVEAKVRALAEHWGGGAAEGVVKLLLMWYHDLLAVEHGLPPTELVHADRLAELERAKGSLSLDEIRRRAGLLEELVDALGHRVNPDLALYAALSRLGTSAEAGASPF